MGVHLIQLLFCDLKKLMFYCLVENCLFVLEEYNLLWCLCDNPMFCALVWYRVGDVIFLLADDKRVYSPLPTLPWNKL